VHRREVDLGLGELVDVVGKDVEGDVGDEFEDLGVGVAGGAELACKSNVRYNDGMSRFVAPRAA
jgi:hypothetical protein